MGAHAHREADVAVSRLRRALDAHLGSPAVARLTYGSIIGLALVVALERHPPTAGQTVAAILGTAVAVGLAEIYSEIVGAEARERRRVRREEVHGLVGDAAAVVFGAAFPAVFFVAAAAGLVEVGTAFTLAKWTGLGLITAYGFAAARLGGDKVGAALLHALAVGAIGGALIALKAVLH